MEYDNRCRWEMAGLMQIRGLRAGAENGWDARVSTLDSNLWANCVGGCRV